MVTEDEMLAREAIRDTLARYNMAGDSLRADEFLAVFTRDAVLQSHGAEGAGFRYTGIEEIAAWIKGWRAPATPAGPATSTEPTAPRQRMFVRHHLSTSVIDFADTTTAHARTYFTVYTPIGPDHGGVYTDELRREGETWLIAERTVRTEWHAPNGYFRPKDQA
jgi:hypothetical protein